VIVGRVTLEEVRRVAQQAFGAFPTRPRSEEPAAGEERPGTATLRFDAAPSVAIAFHKPTLPDASEYSFDVIQSLLCEGRSSRLEKKLVYDRRIAKSVYCSDGYPASRLPNLFVIWVEPLKGHSLASVRKVIGEELADLRKNPVGAEELARARKGVTASIVYALDSNDDLAEALARYQTAFGDWRILAEYPRRISEVDAAAVQRVANRYLNDAQQIVVERERAGR
jgi:predicted Zn-dependent peptidase